MGWRDAFKKLLGTDTALPRPRPAPAHPTAPAPSAMSPHATVPSTPPPPPERESKSLYLKQEHHAELLRVRPDGWPPVRLIRHNGALWLREDTTGKLVNVDNRYLPRLGIWGANVRGDKYYEAKARIGPAELVREPDNPHDPNAVAVHCRGRIVGHYNKGMTPRLARLLDGGEPLVARFVSANPPKVIAARQEVLDYLYGDVH